MQISRNILRRRQFWVLFGLLLLVSGVYWSSRPAQPNLDHEEFIITAPPIYSLPAGTPLTTRVWVKIIEFKDSLGSRKNNANSFTFSANPTNLCSIHGLLNQCSEVTGRRYYIQKGVAAGSVEFGHTNALSGPQWVAAFENELKTGKVEWYDFTKKEFHHENLTLIPYNDRIILVVPNSLAEKYQP